MGDPVGLDGDGVVVGVDGVVLGAGVLGVVVGAGVVGAGVVGAGVAVVGCVGVALGVVGRLVVGVGLVDVFLDDGAAHGGVGVLDVTAGDPVGIGTNGLPTGRDGLVLDLDVPCVRSTVGPDELLDSGTCVLDVSCEPDGRNNHAPGIATATIAITPNFRTSGRRRLCRAPNFRTCRPRWNCLTTQTFRPQADKDPTESNASIEAHRECLNGAIGCPSQLHRAGPASKR